MKLGVMTTNWAYCGYPLEYALGRAADIGYQYVDIFARRPHAHPDMSKRERKWLVEVVESLELKISDLIGFQPANFASPDQKEREIAIKYTEGTLQLAVDLNCKHMLTLLGGFTMGYPRQKSWENLLESLKVCTKKAGDKGVYMALEFEPKPFCVVQTLFDLKRLLEEIGSEYAKANVDIGHCYAARHAPEELELLKDQIIHAHICDNRGVHENIVVGTGDINVEAYFGNLKKYGFEQTCRKLGFEAVGAVELTDYPHPDACAIESYRWLIRRFPEFAPSG